MRETRSSGAVGIVGNHRPSLHPQAQFDHGLVKRPREFYWTRFA